MLSKFFAWSWLAGLLVIASYAQAREWKCDSGKYSFEADLFAFDDEHVIVQRADKELAMIDIDQLCESDREYLKSKEADELRKKNLMTPQTWTTTSGLKLTGRLVDYVRDDVTIQRRRGQMYVNDRVFANLPEIYRQLVPQIVEHFDGVEIPDERALQTWLLGLRGQPRTFQLEGVILELENGDEYAIPFFVFSREDRKLLMTGWANWLAAQHDEDEQDDIGFRLESLAAAHLKNQEMQRQIAVMDLNLQAVIAGITSVWEVTLYPVQGNSSPPRWVVAMGRNSAQATANALQQNPGFVAGPVRRLSN